MDGSLWFSMWSKRHWPYDEVTEGAHLYWYERPARTIVWRTRIVSCTTFPYDTVREALDRLRSSLAGDIDEHQEYLASGRPEPGYAIGFVVDRPDRVDWPKPPYVKFARLGWERAERLRLVGWILD
jgi:hypothetical protein